MKTVLLYLKDFLKENFNYKTYSLTALFLICCIYVNYQYNFEDKIIDAWYGKPERTLWYFLFYAFSYYGTVLIQILTAKKKDTVLKKEFWLYTLFGLIVLSLDASFSWHSEIGKDLPWDVYILLYKILGDLSGIIATTIPLWLFYLLTKNNRDNFYGLSTTNTTSVNYYFLMLLIMTIPILWASFQEDFLTSYPTFPDNEAYKYLNIPRGIAIGIYEFFYAFDFITVELLFRGFFIIGLYKVLGDKVLLPMVSTYAFLHFGKPLGETIGSIFGGFILGVFALKTRNIWGGIILHVGVALLMELAAFIQKT